MRVAITGASNFVNRMFEACGPYQWAREFLKNSLEAKASKIEFGLEWQAVEKLGVYRRVIADDGIGMDGTELVQFFSTLGAGAKKIGSVHENFGVGAKIASLPWNPEGVVVISYKGGRPSMIRIALEPDSGEYELFEYQTVDGKSCVIDPSEIEWPHDDVDWGEIAPDWVRPHGTAIVLLGTPEQPDTVLGNPGAGESAIKGLSVYLNSRFWDLTGVNVRVVELRSERKTSWPTSQADRDDARRANNRTILGAKYYLVDVKAPHGKLVDSGIVLLDEDRVTAEWYLWDGERPNIDSYAKRLGYIAVRYGDELYQLGSGKVQFRAFGAIESEVQHNLTIVLEVQHYDPRDARWGVHPDQSRNRLHFTGNGEKGVEPPLFEWGREFADHMPEPIREAVLAARGDGPKSVDNEEYRKRLQDKFGNRWTNRTLVKQTKKTDKSQPATSTSDEIEGPREPGPDIATGESGIKRKAKKKTVMVLRKKAVSGGTDAGIEIETPVDVPRYRYGRSDKFEQPWHIALWAPNDPDGPTVILNSESPVLEESVRYHQDQYPDVYAEEVANVVRDTFGEVAACKIAHSQKLSRLVPEEQLNEQYRSETALTVALMGLLAEESLISQRLGKLGKKKTAA